MFRLATQRNFCVWRKWLCDRTVRTRVGTGVEYGPLHEGQFAYPRAPTTDKQKNRPVQHDHLLRYEIILIGNLYQRFSRACYVHPHNNLFLNYPEDTVVRPKRRLVFINHHDVVSKSYIVITSNQTNDPRVTVPVPEGPPHVSCRRLHKC